MENKYITMFQELANRLNFRDAVNHMGTYFLGLLDNVHYDDFIKTYYKDFVTFTNWLLRATPDEVWDSEFGDEEPLLYKLVDTIQDVIETPDSLELALKKSIARMTPSSLEILDKIADHYIGKNRQIVIHVDTFDDEGKILHTYDDKFTKKEQKDSAKMVRDNIGAGLALVTNEGGYLTIKERSKGHEIISVFHGVNGDTLVSLPEDEAEEIFEDYTINNKDMDIEFDCYIPMSEMS